MHNKRTGMLCLSAMLILCLVISAFSPARAHILNSDTWSVQIRGRNIDGLTSNILREEGQYVRLHSPQDTVERYEIPVWVASGNSAIGLDEMNLDVSCFVVDGGASLMGADLSEPEYDDESGMMSTTLTLLVSYPEQIETVSPEEDGDTEEEPVKETPAEETPAEEEPAEETPAEETPAEETPAEETPAEETPAEETPAEETSAEETSAEEEPAEETSAEEEPTEETPTEETSAEEEPTEETPAEEEPTEETPAEEEPTEEIPAEKEPAEEEPAEETPAEETPAEEDTDAEQEEEPAEEQRIIILKEDISVEISLNCDEAALMSATIFIPAEPAVGRNAGGAETELSAYYNPAASFCLQIEEGTNLSFSETSTLSYGAFPAMTSYCVYDGIGEPERWLLLDPDYIPAKAGQTVEIDLSNTEVMASQRAISIHCGSYRAILSCIPYPNTDSIPSPLIIEKEGAEIPADFVWVEGEPAFSFERLADDTQTWEAVDEERFTISREEGLWIVPEGARAGSYRVIMHWTSTAPEWFYSEIQIVIPAFVRYRQASEGI